MEKHMQVNISLHPYDITNSNFKSQQKPLNVFANAKSITMYASAFVLVTYIVLLHPTHDLQQL